MPTLDDYVGFKQAEIKPKKWNSLLEKTKFHNTVDCGRFKYKLIFLCINLQKLIKIQSK